ncbi:GGDEF domain-containing protein [Luteimonas sp. MC1782]|uniref:GGDEF domain-containing protein n=1 Tax=Luteimonas sp. MC1782 TaxID=2760305 RepID=UPI001C71EBDF|nr:GGDEF domain-containing protein [Luteimonas sp. MC1782]
MRKQWLMVCLLVSLLPGAVVVGAENAGPTATFDARLEQADTLRSADPATFRELLAELNATTPDDLTAGQGERLDYLNAYALVLGGRYEEGIAAATALFERAQGANMKVRAGALVVNARAITRDFAGGLRMLGKVLPFTRDDIDDANREHVFGVAAVIHNQAGQYRIGREYAERVLSTTEAPRARCFAGQTRLQAMQELKQSPAEDREFTALVDVCEAQREAVVANLVRAMLARKWDGEGNRPRAVAILERHLPEVERTGYPPLIGEFHALLAEYKLAAGDPAGADAHALATIERGGGDFTRSLVAAHLTRYRVAEARNDPVQALAHYRRYAEADKAQLDEVKARELAYQIVSHETFQQTQQIELLNRQNEVLQLQQRVQEQSAQNSRLLVLMLLLLLASIAFWAYKTKRVQVSLRHLAETDALTGISNRHHFNDRAAATLARSARMGEDAALVMFDLDRFKSINDHYGHGVGDWVLQRVVEACATARRDVDWFGRLGGEEFALLLVGADGAEAVRVAEECRRCIAAIDTRGSGYAFAVTASFGISTTTLSGYDLTRLLTHADRMLYRAKRGGRNRVCLYGIPGPAALPVADAHPPSARMDEPVSLHTGERRRATAS